MIPKKIIGLDPPSFRNIGWSVMETAEVDGQISTITCTAGTFVMPKALEPWHSLWPMFMAIDVFLMQQEPNLVIIEKTSSFAGGFITGQVSNCIGVILACCGKHSLDVKFVNPKHVKKVITGNGNASKTQIKNDVKKLLHRLGVQKVSFNSQHAYDAVGSVLSWFIDKNMLNLGESK